MGHTVPMATADYISAVIRTKMCIKVGGLYRLMQNECKNETWLSLTKTQDKK